MQKQESAHGWGRMVEMSVDSLTASAGRLRHSVILRLLATVVLFSCAVTVLLSGLQLYRDYSHGIAAIQTRLSDIDASNRESLSESLWQLNETDIKLHLNGMLRLSDICSAEIHEAGPSATPLVIHVGNCQPSALIAREFPIFYRINGYPRQIGTLRVQATLDNLYHALLHTALFILASQAAYTFVVTLFTIYIFSRFVTRHLVTISSHVGEYDFRVAPEPLVLPRRQPRQPDELDRVVSAFNNMGARLHDAYLRERDAAAQREARHAAETANRAKSEFLANMSHELRTPLNGILGYAQILLRDVTQSPRQREAVGIIQRSGEHLLTLIDDTLDFARIEAGKLRIEIADVPLQDVLDSIRDIIGLRAEQKHLEFLCDVTPELGSAVRADERRLRQVLLNLLANAVRFTDTGWIGLRVSRAPSGAVRFCVRDSGIGIASDKLGAVFEPFEQAGSPERRAGGAGLGLAISQQFVRAMGGTIRVESTPGRGSAFSFELPACVADPSTPPVMPLTLAATPAPDARRITGYTGARRTVLIMDDEAVNRAVVSEFLQQLGFGTVEAANGLDGLAIAQRDPPSLIITDVIMPALGGLEATRRLRRLPETRDIPVIALSASTSWSDEKQCIDAGANAFLTKPVDFRRLQTQLATLLALEWTYVTRAAPLPGDTPRVSGPVLPEVEAQALHHAARLGHIRAVVAWADRIAALDTRHLALADQLRALAKDFQSRSILLLAEEQLERSRQP
ncbi:MAG TPA: ATP-binding protein [Paraburkholderia sp.]|nr:ATP-binding protein [Paraburkholderia sp.]